MKAQIFVVKDSLVSDIYPIQSSNQVVNTLEENIRLRGAMNKLISEYTQVQIQTKSKISSKCTTAVVGTLNPTIRTRTLLNGGIGPQRLDQHHP